MIEEESDMSGSTVFLYSLMILINLELSSYILSTNIYLELYTTYCGGSGSREIHGSVLFVTAQSVVLSENLLNLSFFKGFCIVFRNANHNGTCMYSIFYKLLC